MYLFRAYNTTIGFFSFYKYKLEKPCNSFFLHKNYQYLNAYSLKLIDKPTWVSNACSFIQITKLVLKIKIQKKADKYL